MKNALTLVNVSEDEYNEWCTKNGLPKQAKSSKSLFFNKILNGEIKRDEKTKKLLYKEVTKDV